MHCIGKVLFILATVFLISQLLKKPIEHFDFCECIKDAQTGMAPDRELEQQCRQECITSASSGEKEAECQQASLYQCKLTPTATSNYLSQIKLIKNIQ